MNKNARHLFGRVFAKNRATHEQQARVTITEGTINTPGSSNDHITNIHHDGTITNDDASSLPHTDNRTHVNKNKWNILNWLGLKI